MIDKERSNEVAKTPNATFSIRLKPGDYNVLMSLANLKNVSLAVLARDYILEGMARDLNPEEIERQIDRERNRLLKAAAEMRAMRATDDEHHEEVRDEDTEAEV
ncbi:hypothetical protein [Nocardia thailandica]|uniref:hypothetical protein n=1 Tax=Nocardia thailandica TaxID=257275 RepID=UPI000302BF55|nr:hypothetical protein [Nocardia thailandica]